MRRRPIFKTVVFPLAEKYSGTSIAKKLAFLKISQNWSRNQLEDYQNARLSSLIHHAYENVPYYRTLFDSLKIRPKDIKTKKGLKKIPFLTKEIIRANQEGLRAENYLNRSFKKFTSGSTGTPLDFYQTKEDYSWQWSGHYRAWGWAGYTLGDKYVKISLNDDRKLWSKKIQDGVMKCLYLYVYRMMEEDIDAYLKKIIKFKPRIIYGYSSSLTAIAEFMLKRDLEYNAQAVITTGSDLTPNNRRKIEKAFRCEVFDGYGCGGEGLNIAAECEKHKYHVNDELLILEKDGWEVVVTSLFNYAMSLIRYKPGDNVALGGRCNCGKSLSLIKTLNGRSDEVVLTKRGEILVIEFFISAFEFIDGINQYKVIQDNLAGVTLQMSVNNRYNKKRDEQKILNFIRDSAGRDFRIKIEYLDSIPLEKNGKSRIIVSRLKVKMQSERGSK